jgi:5-methylcytosine-specific restriction endonuclease McrA
MTNTRKSLKILRSHAFLKQDGFCYYCKQPMWVKNPLELSSKYELPLSKLKKLKCTGEHLVAFKDGGSSTKNNIVAACSFCNQHRHRRKTNPTPEQFGKMVQYRVSRDRWHGVRLNAYLN